MLNRLIALIYSFIMLGSGMVEGYVSQTQLGGNLFLANRQYLLDVQYEPDDLVELKLKSANPGQRLRKEAAESLAELFSQAKKESVELVVVSGYRSYFSQKNIFTRRVRRAKGNVSEAQKSVAPPGTSEHQLGLACDVGKLRGNSLVSSFGSTREGKWLRDNAHRFGFVIRFAKEWEHVTGYIYEPWHIRYVGREHAKIMHEKNIPLEYYVFALKQAMYGNLTLDEEKNAEAMHLLFGTGSLDNENQDSAVDAGAAGKAVTDTSITDTSITDTSITDTSITDTSVTDSSVPNTGVDSMGAEPDVLGDMNSQDGGYLVEEGSEN